MLQLLFEISVINTAEKTKSWRLSTKAFAMNLKLSQILSFLTWLEHSVWKRDYFKLWRGSRKAIWKWPRVNRRHYWQWHHFFSGLKKLDFSCFVTGIKSHRKRSNRQADRLTEQEVELPKVLTPRLTHSLVSKYDNALYGELLASKFMSHRGLQKLQAKHKIDNFIFKYLLVRKGSATRTLLEPSANQVGAKFHICYFRPVKWWGTCHYSPATNKHVPTTPKANGNYVYPTYSRWRFWESLIPITKKLFTYADILIVPDNQFSARYLFRKNSWDNRKYFSNNEFHEEKQLFVFVRKYHFVCNLPNFMDKEIDISNKNHGTMQKLILSYNLSNPFRPNYHRSDGKMYEMWRCVILTKFAIHRPTILLKKANLCGYFFVVTNNMISP